METNANTSEKVEKNGKTEKPETLKTKFHILCAISLAHFLNDATQSLLMPLYPLFMREFSLSFIDLGLLTMTSQITGSILQPFVGFWTDRHFVRHSLPIGMCFIVIGLLVLAMARHYTWLIFGAFVLGLGSSVFHPESSRVARSASGGHFGMAQSFFQVGGNAGQAFGPLLAAAIVMPRGQHSILYLVVLPLTALALLLWVSGGIVKPVRTGARALTASSRSLPKAVIARVFAVLLILIFSKYFYIASINNYFIFYLTHKFGVTVENAQVRLFFFMFAMAAGTLLGGPLGDRIGRRYVIWFSILGAAPFTMIMPYLNLEWTSVMIFVIGFVLSSAFSAIVVFAQELVPGHVGTIAGLFFGLSFGMGGIGAAVLGKTADVYGIEAVYAICSYLPLLGLFAVFLPSDRELS